MASTWTMLKLLEWLKEYLNGKGVPNPRLDAEHLIAHALNISRMDLYLQFERILTKEELAVLKPMIERRARREPLQYILGTQPFRNVSIKVNKNVLIPRPETEIVVGEVLKKIPEDAGLEVLELCVGSGAIIAALASERKKIKITGVEIDRQALTVANQNTEPYCDRVELFEGDLFEPVKGRRFNIIVSNPPYCAKGEWATLEPEVKDYEPKGALVAGEDGLDFYRRILKDASDYLAPDGWLILELGDGRGEALMNMAKEMGSFCDITIRKDFNEKDRVLMARHHK